MVNFSFWENTFWNMISCHSYSDPPHNHMLLLLCPPTQEADFRPDFNVRFSLLTAAVSSRPGQSGRADGYILEGKELEFYLRKIKSKKTK